MNDEAVCRTAPATPGLLKIVFKRKKRPVVLDGVALFVTHPSCVDFTIMQFQNSFEHTDGENMLSNYELPSSKYVDILLVLLFSKCFFFDQKAPFHTVPESRGNTLNLTEEGQM